MKYLFCIISLVLLSYGLISFFQPKKAKRIIHILAYIFPFWIWGFVFIIISINCWQFKTDKNHNFAITIFCLLVLIKGLFLIFYPKRKIKKKIEKWENFPDEIKKIYGIVFIIIAFLIYLIAV